MYIIDPAKIASNTDENSTNFNNAAMVAQEKNVGIIIYKSFLTGRNLML